MRVLARTHPMYYAHTASGCCAEAPFVAPQTHGSDHVGTFLAGRGRDRATEPLEALSFFCFVSPWRLRFPISSLRTLSPSEAQGEGARESELSRASRFVPDEGKRCFWFKHSHALSRVG